MILPKRGLLVNEEGKATWAWEHNDPDRDFDALPPFVSTLDGSDMQSVATPGSVVIDLDEVGLGRDDIHLLHSTLDKTRLRKRADGTWRLTQVIPDDTTPAVPGSPSTGEHPLTEWAEGEAPPLPDHPQEIEIDHPLIDVINARRQHRGQDLLKKGA